MKVDCFWLLDPCTEFGREQFALKAADYTIMSFFQQALVAMFPQGVEAEGVGGESAVFQ